MNPTESNRQLIMAILHRAVVDAMEKPSKRQGKYVMTKNAMSAFEFFDSGVFETYAESINIDPDAFRSNLNRYMMREDGSNDKYKRDHHEVQIKRHAYRVNRSLWNATWKEHLA